MFQDELVIRWSSGFELTLRARKILQELEQLLPKIEALVVPSIVDRKRAWNVAPVNTIRIRLGHEWLDLTLAYLKGKYAESEAAQEHARSSNLVLYA